MASIWATDLWRGKFNRDLGRTSMFAFYDFETTSTSAAFDQPIQFAAILTDDEFNQIERVDIRCRLSPHILPALWAEGVAQRQND
jgi:exonuclease I